MSSLADYQTEHLFLLIGNNPLPNYVAMKLLANENTTVHLVHSAETLVFAQRLENKLKDGCKFAEKICVKPSSANEIKKKIEARLGGISGSVGLNYTGGTKAMAVHVYRAIAGKVSEAKFSYLDPRNLAMLIDAPEAVESEMCFSLGKPEGNDYEKEYFRKTKISLEDLLYLHQLELFRDIRDEPRGLKIAEAIQSEAVGKDSWWKFQKKLREDFENAKKEIGYQPYNNRNEEQMKAQLRLKKIKFPGDLSNLAGTFEENFLSRNIIKLGEMVLANLPEDLSAIEFVNFLLGTWLEDFVLSRVKQVKEKCFLKYCGASVETSLRNNKKKRFFELDVVAMRGYRLFAISCSQESSVFKAKHKLFEAVHRAKQLGGDEARIALVCLAESWDINNIKTQLEEDHIEVFGREDLGNLEQELERWFNRKG
ncbi:MAG TPA: DUF1887 family CARF protein [Pyrinomonadaceae bacterium]|nr:DUF1887 family CARF protein [Pyrinomonadaceae bacterium]